MHECVSTRSCNHLLNNSDFRLTLSWMTTWVVADAGTCLRAESRAWRSVWASTSCCCSSCCGRRRRRPLAATTTTNGEWYTTSIRWPSTVNHDASCRRRRTLPAQTPSPHRRRRRPPRRAPSCRSTLWCFAKYTAWPKVSNKHGGNDQNLI